ncbi:MAG: hypothetical protein MI864_16035 [Pseudomonadales bacterium]|nr:hypothetical protein [Pseudomonadales bacterium]
MSDIHIEDFCKDVAKILVQLYTVFPRRTSVYVEDIAGEDNPDEYGLHGDRHMACFGAMIWLAEENYIRYVDTIRQEAVDQAILTHKALNLLSRICNDSRILHHDTNLDEHTLRDLPQDIATDRKTHINILREVIAGGSSTRISRVVQRLILELN